MQCNCLTVTTRKRCKRYTSQRTNKDNFLSKKCTRGKKFEVGDYWQLYDDKTDQWRYVCKIHFNLFWKSKKPPFYNNNKKK
jgi:hypothetical protein